MPVLSVSGESVFPAALCVATIDGPVGVGKSVLAHELARALNWTALDTGAMYRAVALKALRLGISLENSNQLAEIARSINLRFASAPEQNQVFLDEQDVTLDLRRPDISNATPLVARHASVREAMVAQQRRLGEQGQLVAEGRDMGTIVFPDAIAKFYLTASVEERFQRRRTQLIEQAQTPPVDNELRRQIEERDTLDRQREVGALRAAPDSILIDTTHFTKFFVLQLMAALTQSALQKVA